MTTQYSRRTPAGNDSFQPTVVARSAQGGTAKSAAIESVIIPGTSALTVDQLNRVGAANIWYEIADFTGEAGVNGSWATLDDPITLGGNNMSKTVVSLGEYRNQIEEKMKANGWWDETTGTPVVTKEYMNMPVVDPVTGTVTKPNGPTQALTVNQRTFVPVGSKYVAPSDEELKAAWLAQKQRIASRVETDPAVIGYEKMLELYGTTQRTSMGGDIQSAIDTGDISLAARFFNEQVARGEFQNVDFLGTWGGKSTTSVVEYGSWLNQAAGGARGV